MIDASPALLDAARRVATGGESPSAQDRATLEPVLREMMGVAGPMPVEMFAAGMWDVAAALVIAESAPD